MDAKLIEELARKLAGSLPPGMRAVREDIEQNFRAVLQAGLTRMDLVTREEFEAVKAVASTARAEQERLARRIARLEAELAEVAARSVTAGGTGLAEDTPPPGAPAEPI